MCIFHERHVCLHPVHFIVMLPSSPTLVIAVLFHINSFLQFSVSFVHIVNSIYYLFLYTGFNHFDYHLIVLNISWSLSVTPTVDPGNHRTEIYVTALLPTRGGMLYIVLHKNHP